MPAIPLDEDQTRLISVLRGIAAQETARLRDGTLPWQWWLERAALHGRRYGFTGTLLISAQWRAATDVRSYEEWRAAGRQVRKGETGIRVFTRSGGLRAVFDVAQTSGLPLPPGPGAGREADPGKVVARLAPLAAHHGVDGTSGGLAELVHQLSHALRPGDRIDRPGSPECQGVRRVEADSVAFLVLSWLGMEPSAPVFPVNAFWAGPGVGDRILRIGRRIYERASEPSDGGVMTAAHRFFRSCHKDSWVPAYLAGRGFPAGVQRRWQIGYAPSGPRALTDHLRTLGHDDEEIVAAGLARRGSEGRPFDTFRDRAMFAIRTADGAVAGFIGRRPDGADGPKYLNGPDTALFHKGELLYGLHEARDRLAAGARPVLVEGPLDVLAVTMAGAAEHAAVATCGLSLTGAQLAALAGAADLGASGVLVALDGDPAGRTAAVRTWETLARVGGPVEAVALPAGRDPADVLREDGRAAVLRALRTRAPLMDAVVDAAVARAGGTLATAEQRLAALRAASKIIVARPPEAARQVVRLAASTRVPAALITDLLIEAASR
ncbi:toprim domain-containing protein [Actinomadura rubrisoli]|uniref:Toprim domain-containing protein n=1 Tax=Actinomadura rubrisoli TaxID=2530368 RepID=A0A4V6PF38_9ACTN|nr:toprim domain-containing protein [Actinomadura rubrisoli]TDD90807.1 toprim domain-containing protein [Actinomadura rubrisoli]